jgi:hypothetical protein
MSSTTRYLLIIAAVGAIVIAIVFLIGAKPVRAQEACVAEGDQQRIRDLTLTGIDQALVAHVASLFDIWLKDFSPEPTRAMAGMANGISAYQRARANALQWHPPTC